MQFDPENKIVKLCAEGMAMEGESDKAKALFEQAWNESSDDLEKFIAAHYIARHQTSVTEKLHWDETALKHALLVEDESMKGTYPSLYLNIAKCYEDLGSKEKAKEQYTNALSYVLYLPADGYGKLIRKGIENGLERINS